MRAAGTAPADGYTLLLGNNAILATNASLYSKIGFDPVKDFAPVALLGSSPFVMVTYPGLPARDLREFIALAKADAVRGIVAGLAVAFIGIVADRLIGGASAKARAKLVGANA